jgi:hypothetical protein
LITGVKDNADSRTRQAIVWPDRHRIVPLLLVALSLSLLTATKHQYDYSPAQYQACLEVEPALSLDKRTACEPIAPWHPQKQVFEPEPPETHVAFNRLLIFSNAPEPTLSSVASSPLSRSTRLVFLIQPTCAN